MPGPAATRCSPERVAQHCSGFYSAGETIGNGVRNMLDLGIDEPLARCRDQLLAAGLTMENFNILSQDLNEVHDVCSNLSVGDMLDHRGITQRQCNHYIKNGAVHHLLHASFSERRRRCPPVYPHPVFDWASCRAGLLVALQGGELHLLVYHADNPSRAYDAANKRILLGTLPHGQQHMRRYIPAVSVLGSEGALELRAATRLPSGHPDLLEQLRDAAATAGDFRALAAEMGDALVMQRGHLQEKDREIEVRDRVIAHLRAELERIRAPL